jgi:hypothetical protein
MAYRVIFPVDKKSCRPTGVKMLGSLGPAEGERSQLCQRHPNIDPLAAAEF